VDARDQHNRDRHDRYSRQVRFAPIGERGQQRISQARVCIVGVGALGSFQAEALARAGIGSLRLIDRDTVDFSNLQRQFLYDENDAAAELPKAIAAKRRLELLNHNVRIEAVVADVTASNAEELLADSQLILDGTDNFETRYLVNDLSVRHRIPWIYGAAVGSAGIVMPVVPERGPCFACIYPEPPAGPHPTCDVNGILAVASASVAALQVSLALRLVVGWQDFVCRIHSLDLWNGAARQIDAGRPDPECTVCALRQFRHLENPRPTHISLCGRNAVQIHETSRPLDLADLARRFEPLGEVRVNEFALRLALPKYDLMFFPDGRAIIRGTQDIAVARSLYAQLIGN
jgi:adenylyltransferase/sulfurtransferase